VIGAAALLVLALLGQPQSRTYYWRDAAGQTHITNTPPPVGAEVLEAPPPSAMEAEQSVHKDPSRPRSHPEGKRQVELNPVQQKAWEAIDRHLASARLQGDRKTLEAVTESLIHQSLWGHGLWFMPTVPILAVLLMGLLGWWLALGLGSGPRSSLVGGFLLLGLGLGHLLLNIFLYHPQAAALRQNLELLERHLGTGKPLRTEQRVRMQQHYQALEQAAEPLQAPWRFPAEVQSLRATMKQVVLDP